MEGNSTVKGVGRDFIGDKNLKPFLSVFIILLIILSGYYFFWRSVTIKMKNIVADSIQGFKYDSINISGFPFSKRVKINDITFASNVFLLTKNQVNVKQVTISSFIFSGNLDIKLKDVSTFSSIDGEAVYSLNYNEEPDISVGFYSDGRLKKFSYSDVGYRVISSDNKTLYRADRSVIDVQSTRDGDTVNYALNGDMQNMQNISIIEKDNEASVTIEPELYNMKFDISSSITKDDGELEESIIKINNFTLLNASNGGISVSGEIIRDTSDPYSYGEVKVGLSNYARMLADYQKDSLKALAIENDAEGISNEEKAEYTSMMNNLFTTINRIIKKNPETTANTGVIVIARAKNTPDYILNGESLINIIQQIVEKPTEK